MFRAIGALRGKRRFVVWLQFLSLTTDYPLLVSSDGVGRDP